MTKTKEERLQDILDTMEESTIVKMWNERCDSYRYDDDRIYYMSELDDIIGKVWASELLERIDRDFDPSDEYFKDGVWGFESFSDIYDVVDDDDLIEYIINEDEDFNDDDIREVLDDEEDEEEDF